MAKNNTNNVLALLALVVLVFSLISVGVTFYKFSQFKEQITGFASGYVNLTVSSSVSINMTDDRVDWSSGNVNASEGNASLVTYGTTAVVTRGNWSTAGIDAMEVMNIGNNNCTLNLSSNKNAAQLLGSTAGTNQSFKWNITNKEANSCYNVSTGQLGNFLDVNTTIQTFCSPFVFYDSRDEIYIDIALEVPYDTNTTFLGAEQTATITIICT